MTNETAPIPEGYLVAVPRRPPAPEPAREGADARFSQFSEMCSAFSRMIYAEQGRRNEFSSRRDVDRNLAIARTVFAKWGVEIMVVLYGAPAGLGFEQLRRELKGVSPRVLSQKLKTLEAQGILSRSVLAERPPRVSYTLTPNGCALARMADPVFLFLDAILTERGVSTRDAERAEDPHGPPVSTTR